MLYAIVALLAIILDQWLKLWVSGNIVLNSGVKELIPGLLSLVNFHNTGAAFGFLGNFAGSRTVFIIVCAVFVVLAIALLAGNVIKGKLGRWCVVMVMAGGVGNCIDRILYGYVQDMIKVDFVNFAIFNVADIFITVFCLLFIVYIIFGSSDKSDDYDDDDDDDDEDYDDDDDEDYDFDDDEEEEPARPLFKGKARAEKKAVEEEPASKAPAGSRKARQQEVDDKYAKFKAERAAREQSDPVVKEAPVRKPTPVTAADPFAEWERKARESRAAEEKAAARKTESSKATQTDDPFAAWENANRRQEPEKKAAPVQSAASARTGKPVSEPVSVPVETPVSAPVEKPVVKKSAPKVSDSFDLEDILNEFK